MELKQSITQEVDPMEIILKLKEINLMLEKIATYNEEELSNSSLGR